MNGNDRDFDQGVASSENYASAEDGRDGSGVRETGGLSRRHFLRASAAAGVAGLGLGVSNTAAAAVAEETCESNAELEAGEGWNLLVNPWGMPSATECVWVNEDGSFGYNFDASGLDPGSINYPEVYCGRRPWGNDSGASEFPLRRGDVDELVLEVDADINISGGEWDWAEEWWLMDGQPTSENPPYTHEIMLVMDWGGGHNHYMEERNVFSDQFGNTFDYWANYSSGGTSADFHIFRVNGGLNGSGKVDLTEIVDFMTQRHGTREDLTISGIEVGNEYWGGASGEVTYQKAELQVNGSTYTAGTGTGNTGDNTAPSAPSNLDVTDTTTSAVTVSWNGSSDSGGSGLDHYAVSADGRESTVSAGSTRTTIDGLDADTTYDVSVSAVDGAGNESSSASVQATTEAETTEPQGTVEIDLSTADVGSGGTANASISLSNAPDGLSGYDVTMSVADASVVTITEAAIADSLSGVGESVQIASDGSSVMLRAADLSENVGAGASDVDLATVTLAAQSQGESDLAVSVQNIDNDGGNDVPVDTMGATLTVSTMDPMNGVMPQDIDSDGHYMDLNANDGVDYDDVVTYFNNMDNPAMTDHVDAYDYNDNDEIDYADVVELFQNVD